MNDTASDQEKPHKAHFSRYVQRALITLVIAVLALFFWQIVDVLLLAFAGMLLAVIWHGFASVIKRYTRLSNTLALILVPVLVLGLLALLGWWLGPRLMQQFSQLAQQLPQSIDQLRQTLQQYSWGQTLLNHTSQQGQQGLSVPGNRIVSSVTGVASVTFTVIIDLLLILAVGIFLVINPSLYKNGIVRLLPYAHRERMRQFLDSSGYALWKWLTGQLVTMLLVGLLTVVGLWLVGVPLPIVLGLIAAALDFVPFIGPIAAAIPGVLLAFTKGGSTALYAVLVYFIVQQVEGNVIEPVVQSHVVSLSPVLIILAVVATGVVLGPLGVIIAVPLWVVIMVAVKMFYVEDVLGDKVDLPHR